MRESSYLASILRIAPDPDALSPPNSGIHNLHPREKQPKNFDSINATGRSGHDADGLLRTTTTTQALWWVTLFVVRLLSNQEPSKLQPAPPSCCACRGCVRSSLGFPVAEGMVPAHALRILSLKAGNIEPNSGPVDNLCVICSLGMHAGARHLFCQQCNKPSI